MPRIAMHGIIVPTHGEALYEIDRKIFSVAAEGQQKMDSGGSFADINVTIDFIKTLLQRRDTVINEFRKECKALGVNPGKLYPRRETEDVDRGMAEEERGLSEGAG